jgi:hypothetical protein
VANATSLHRRSADTRERGWHVRFGSKAAIKTAMDLVRFVSPKHKGSPYARDQSVTHARGIFGVAGKAFAQGSFLDEDAYGESAKD